MQFGVYITASKIWMSAKTQTRFMIDLGIDAGLQCNNRAFH